MIAPYTVGVYYFYVIKSKKLNKVYYGSANDLKRRVREHNRATSGFTSLGKPWKLVYYEAYLSKEDAAERERAVKLRKNSYVLLRKRIKRSIEL